MSALLDEIDKNIRDTKVIGQKISDRVQDGISQKIKQAEDFGNKFKGSELYKTGEQGYKAIDNLIGKTSDENKGKTWKELNNEYKDAKQKLKDYKNVYNKSKKLSGAEYNKYKQETLDTYNQLKKNAKLARKQKVAKGWENFKSGVSKAFNFGKNVFNGIKSIFGGSK